MCKNDARLLHASLCCAIPCRFTVETLSPHCISRSRSNGDVIGVAVSAIVADYAVADWLSGFISAGIVIEKLDTSAANPTEMVAFRIRRSMLRCCVFRPNKIYNKTYKFVARFLLLCLLATADILQKACKCGEAFGGLLEHARVFKAGLKLCANFVAHHFCGFCLCQAGAILFG